MKLSKIAGLSALALILAGSAFAGTITLWDYNGGSLNPSIGSGSMAVRNLPGSPSKWDTDLGDYDLTRTENDSSDPAPIRNAGTPLQARGYRAEWGKVTETSGCWNLTDPPGTQAVIWNTSTANKSNIHVRMDVRVKSYDPKYFQIQYTTNGTTWVTYPQWFECRIPQEQASWFNHCEIDLSGIPAVNNNPNFAFAFVMAYGPGKSAYEPSWVNPGAWPIAGQYPRYAFDMVEVYSGTSSITDSTPPTIKAVYVTRPLPDQAPVEGNVHVQVSATDNAVVSSVLANGVSLSRTGLYTWDGNVPGSGSTVVNVVASDEAGHTATATKTGFTPTVTLNGLHVNYDEWGGLQALPMLSKVCYWWPIKVYGMVSTVDSNYFDLQDAAGNPPVRIFAPGYALADGDFASASGILTQSIDPYSWITSHAALVEKRN